MKKKILVMMLVVVLVGMTVGYSILSKQLKIEGTVNVDTKFDVQITGITKFDNTTVVSTLGTGGTAIELSSPTYTSTTANFNVKLEPNASISYLVTIKNNGTQATFDEPVITKTGNADVTVTTPIEINNKMLDSNGTLNYLVTIKYVQSNDMDNSSNDASISVKFNAKQSNGSQSFASPYLVFEDGTFVSNRFNLILIDNGTSAIGNFKLQESIDNGDWTDLSICDDNNLGTASCYYNNATASSSLKYYAYRPGTTASTGVHTIKLRAAYGTVSYSNELSMTNSLFVIVE